MYHLIISAAYKPAEIRQLDCGQTLAMGADIQISRALYNTNYHTTGHSSRHDSFEADTISARVGINFNVWSCKCCNQFRTLKFVLICAPTNTNATPRQTTLCKWRKGFNQLRDNKQHFVASHRKTFKSIHGDKKHILTN